MKAIALVLSLLGLAACASPTAVIDQRRFFCGQGTHDVSVEGGFEDPRRGENVGDPAFLVEVANNSNQEITVARVRIEPNNGKNRNRYRPEVAIGEVVIPEGEAHLFRLPAREPLVAEPDLAPTDFPLPPDRLQFSAVVILTNGDEYHCEFLVQLER
jgi:hypothetical protein